ncbi:hypothetical protein OAA60_02515 [Porticoccaceae bacterium]|nr:hypothetical protein [Porticoccaceae bacterium]
MSLATIEKQCSTYSAAANALNNRVIKLNQKLESVTQAAKPELDALTAQCIKAHAKLHDTISQNEDLFEKPRTQTFSGIKVGYLAGRATFELDEEKTLALIPKKLPELKTVLIKTTSNLVSAALKNLDEKQLKVIGIKRVNGEDSVVLKATDSAVNKSVEAHLKQAKK